jgi:hypothetical protein
MEGGAFAIAAKQINVYSLVVVMQKQLYLATGLTLSRLINFPYVRQLSA